MQVSEQVVNLLGISGSQRAESSNTRLLSVAGRFVPEGARFQLEASLDVLPHFNPDEDIAANPELVRWIDRVRNADGLIVSTPEYARGYPGTLKNALDWLVQTDAHIDKPFMMLNASARGTVAQASLTVVLETMSGIHVRDASLTIPLLGTSSSVVELAEDPDISAALRAALNRFVTAISAL